MKKLDLIGGKSKSRTNKVYDEEGMVKQGKEAVEEWRVLNEGESLEVQEGNKMSVDKSELFDEDISREDVE